MQRQRATQPTGVPPATEQIPNRGKIPTAAADGYDAMPGARSVAQAACIPPVPAPAGQAARGRR